MTLLVKRIFFIVDSMNANTTFLDDKSSPFQKCAYICRGVCGVVCSYLPRVVPHEPFSFVQPPFAFMPISLTLTMTTIYIVLLSYQLRIAHKS